MKIPEHIKCMVERIAEESEAQYTPRIAGERICATLKTENKTYINGEIHLYYAEAAKDFRKQLDTQKAKLFEEEDESALRRRIVYYIDEMMTELSADSRNRVIREVYCEEELEKVLTSKSLEKSVKKEAKEVKSFIQKRKVYSWGQEDSYVDKIFFKYVETLEEFEAILSQGYQELTPGDYDPLNEIRIAFKEKDKITIYKEKGLLEDSRKLMFSAESERRVFDIWNDVKEIGIYYVYVPVSAQK